MKKKMIFAAAAVFMAASVSVFTYISSERNAMDELFNANVEALAQDEIVVGPLCMVAPDRLCYSLGEYYENHQRA